jgi:hypothetical protein
MIRYFLTHYSKTLSIIWALIILILCAIPGQYIPSVSFLELFSFDKWVHAAIFFILCSLIFIHIHSRRINIKWLWFFFIACVIYGVILEWMQVWAFSNRSADWQDMIANAFGCAMALMFHQKIYKLVLN